MWFLVLGVIMIGLKVSETGPVAKLDWWQVLIPLGLAVLWWAWADNTGYTKRKAAEAMEKKRQDRIQKSRDALKAPKRR